jgi:hypothetical protein
MKNFNSVLAMSLVILLSSCGKVSSTDSDESSSVAESALSEAASHATSSEGATGPGILGVITAQELATDALAVEAVALDYVDPSADSVRQFAACSYASARSVCSSNVSTINWAGCTVGTTTLTGSWTEAWSSGFCANGALPVALTNGNSVTRTTTSHLITLASGATISTSTAAHTPYDGVALPGTGIAVSMASGTRTVVINGVNRILTGARGKVLFNHSIKSTGMSVTGTRAGSNRVVTGTTTMYHNLARYTAAHTFNTVTWSDSSCCYPKSGSITTSFSGAKTGSSTMTFSAVCGQATFTDTDGTNSAVTLSQCN